MAHGRLVQLLDFECKPSRGIPASDNPNGECLEGLMGQPMETGLFLRLGAGTAGAVAKLHRQGVVHKDIKPSNILVDRKSGAAWLTGLGNAGTFADGHQAPKLPDTSTISLAYMAPEQTGRMNRSIDARSDLYALGVTFYEMLTGALPFSAAGPMEWVHCHIARKPVPPAERIEGIPAQLSAIVMKLLAKDAGERYQTAAGLEKDLRQCLSEWEAQGRIGEFPLGRRDIPGQLLAPEKLYGRDREIETLLAAFSRVAKTGTPELVLVSGCPGAGKSTVVNELRKEHILPRGLFASGKFDQCQRGIPYANLAQAFAGLIHPVLGKSEAEVEGWRQAIKEALGANGKLITDLVPELKLIIGEQPAVPELEPGQARARFQLVVRGFIEVFARPERPLALFLDDLQRLDAATLDAMEALLTQKEVRYLLVIGAYRNNEVSADHPLMRKLDAIRKASVKVREIALAPLSLGELTQLVAGSFRCEPERAAPLAQLLQVKTEGNPFFAIHFLSMLIQEGLAAFDHSEGTWSWDLDRIQAKEYTSSIADLVAGKLRRLSGKTQSALKQLACLGHSAKASTLSLMLAIPEAEVHAAFQEALSQEIVHRTGDTYRFAHGRLYEAAYALMPEALRAGVHLETGRLLLVHTPSQKREEAVFEIVSQLNRGAGLIEAQDERENLAKLNLIAGKRAKVSAAYTAALSHFSAGMELLTDERWERQRELAFALEINRAECEFLTGKTGTAGQRLTALSLRALDTAGRAAIACLLVDLYMTMAQTGRAVATALDYLHNLGIGWPAHPTDREARREYEQIWLNLGKRLIEDLIDLPLMTDPTSLATMDVLIKLAPPALFTDPNLHCLVTCRAINLSLEHGNSDGACAAYVRLGAIAGPRFGDYKAGYRFGQLAYELVEQRGLKRFQARTYMILGTYVLPWTKHVRTGRDLLRRAFEAANKSGDLTYAGYSRELIISNLLAAGDPLAEVHRQAEAALAFTQKIGHGFTADVIASQLALVRTLRGLTEKFGCFDDEQFEEARFEQHLSSNPDLALPGHRYWTRKAQARFLAGYYPAAIEALERARPLLWTSKSFIEVADYHFYGALSHAARLDNTAPNERLPHMEALAAHRKQLEIWAENCHANFENRAALVSAEIARIEERPLDAMRLYEKAIECACASGFVHQEALAHELAGRFYLGCGVETAGATHLCKARRAYALWGADGKVKQLEGLYWQFAPQQAQPESAGPAVPQLDIVAVINASQALSSEIELPKLIEALMTIALVNAGADRGVLILPRGASFKVEVEAKSGCTEVEVKLAHSAAASAAYPEAVINTAIRTHKSVIIDDTSQPGEFLDDVYLREGQARSVFCLPLLRQGKLTGVLYLENSQAPGAFTADRIAVLDVLAAQAAISLENARLYGELRESEAKYARIVNTASEGIWALGPDGMTAFVNAKMTELLGYSRQEMIGRSPADFMFEVDRPDFAKRMELLRKGSLGNYECRFRRSNGETVWTSASATSILDGENRFQGCFAMLTDITGRKQAEREMSLLNFAMNNVRDAVFLIDENGHFLYVNDEACRELQYSREELLKLSVPDIDPDWPFERWRDHGHRMNGEHDLVFESRHKTKDGRIVPIEVSAVFFKYDNVSYNLALVRDITGRKRAEEEYNRLQMEITRAHRISTMGQLTASIAHEISQPITAACNNAGAALRFLKRTPPHLEQVQEALTCVLDDTSRAGQIIGRIRDLVKKAPPRSESIDINEAVKGVIALVWSEVVKNNIPVQLELAAELPPVQGDRIQLQQVLLNLIHNAIEAMVPAGESERKLSVSTGQTETGNVQVIVQDTGVGICTENAGDIFEAFYTTKSSGIGIGLSLCRSIAEAHGGQLLAEANKPSGALFRFILPAEQSMKSPRPKNRGRIH